MPIEKLALILVCVIAAAAATVWIGAALVASSVVSPALGLAVLSIVALVAYVFWRVIGERVGNKTEDHYDGMDH